jgi:hypothetical protein
MVCALTVHIKRLIYHHIVVLRRSAEDVLAALFFGDPTQCSLDHLKRIASMCRRGNHDRFSDLAVVEGVNLSTIRRTLLRLNQTRKVVERRHMHLCDADRLRMYIRNQHVPVPLVTDTDEISAHPNQSFARLGWAERGRDAIYRHRRPH